MQRNFHRNFVGRTSSWPVRANHSGSPSWTSGTTVIINRERIFSMKTRSSMAPAQMRAPTFSGKNIMGGLRTNSPGHTAHGILVIALLLSGFGVVPVPASGHSADHVSGHHQSGHIRHKTMSDLMGSGHIIDPPWMY